MSAIPFRLVAAAALLPLLPGALLAQAARTPPSAEQGWSLVTRCAQEDSERARHTCLDRVLRDAGFLTNEMSAQQQRRAFGLDEQRAPAAPPAPPSIAPPVAAAKYVAPPARPAPVAPPAAPATSPSAPAPAAQPDLLEVQLASVQKPPDGKLVITTTEGAVWRQSESADMPQPPAAGDRMTIRKGALASYRCSFPATRLTFRCVRSR
jgi:hypothetical protein